MTRLKRKFSCIWGNMRLQKKLILTMSLLVILTVVLVLYFYFLVAELIQERSRKHIENTMTQIQINLNHNIETIEDILFDISTSRELQEMIESIEKTEKESYEYLRLGNDIKNLLISEITKNKALKAAFLYDLNGEIFEAKNEVYDKPQNISFFDIEEKKGANVWFLPDEKQQVFIVGKMINSLENQKKMGYLVLYIDNSYFEKILADVKFSNDDTIIIQDYKKNIICGRYGNDFTHYIYSMPLENNQWEVACSVQEPREIEHMKKLQYITILLFLILLAIVIYVSKVISKSVTNPIKNLIYEMEKFSQGDFSAKASVGYQDEIGILENRFNTMVQDMKCLIQNVYEEKNLKQQAQLKALKMQINPHFLYNTLDVIQWMAQLKYEEEIADMTRCLAYLMRYSLKDCDYVCIEEELDALEHYIRIQKYRYKEIIYEVNIEEEVLYENIPIHTLLPFVENAIEHGLDENKTQRILIIYGKIEESNIHFNIYDNGKGIPKEKIGLILSGKYREKGDAHFSIGIQNVNKRLKIKYGDNYGIEMESELGEGTNIHIKLPISKEIDNLEDENEIKRENNGIIIPE